MRVNKQYGYVIFVALAMLLIMACGSEPTAVPTTAPTLEPTAVPTVAPTVAPATNTPPPTVTPSPTNTPAPTAEIVAPTNTPAPAPEATIDLEAAKSDLPPHVFIGTAMIDGVPAPRGTFVGALIGDQIAGSSLVESDGNFGPLLVDVLGYEVTFQVGDYAATQPPITTEIGESTELELNASSN